MAPAPPTKLQRAQPPLPGRDRVPSTSRWTALLVQVRFERPRAFERVEGPAQLRSAFRLDQSPVGRRRAQAPDASIAGPDWRDRRDSTNADPAASRRSVWAGSLRLARPARLRTPASMEERGQT